MKAIVVRQYGEADVLRIEEVPDPVPGANELLIQTEIASVNYADIKARQGSDLNSKTRLPFIPGHEVVGIIKGMGSEVPSDFRMGQKVVALTMTGGYCELALAPSHLVFPIPDSLSSHEVAGIVALATAYNALSYAGRLVSGETVLIHSAAGGVGSSVVQIAKALGAGMVIGTVGNDAKKSFVESLGADLVLNYYDEHLTEAILNEVGENGVDLIIDSIGGEMIEEGLHCLAPFGRIVILGHTSRKVGLIPSNILQSENRMAIGYRGRAYIQKRPEVFRNGVQAGIQYLSSGMIRLPIAARYPLDKAVDAHRLIESRANLGKVLLEVR